jgi:hypothetical protein
MDTLVEEIRANSLFNRGKGAVGVVADVECPNMGSFHIVAAVIFVE